MESQSTWYKVVWCGLEERGRRKYNGARVDRDELLTTSDTNSICKI